VDRVSRLRSGILAAWYATWDAGCAAPDDVISAVVGDDAPHLVGGLDDYPSGSTAPLSDGLIALRRTRSAVRLVLPVAGDVRGLPGPADFRSAAIEAGEAVVGAGLSLVPRINDYAPSSAPTSVLWRAFATDAAPPDYVSVADAQHDLTTEIRESATALSSAEVSGWIDDISDELSDARRAGERLVLPPGHPARAVALLAQAERLQAVLDIAARDPLGGAIDRTGIAARASSMRPLATAVRRARLAGYNAVADGMPTERRSGQA
jgi:hypothetical protein